MAAKTKRTDGLEVYKDKRGKYRWRNWSRGRITADSAEGDGYSRRIDAENAFVEMILNQGYVFEHNIMGQPLRKLRSVIERSHLMATAPAKKGAEK